MNYNGAGNILLFHFYGLTLIYLTGPLSQVVQLKCDIYIYIYIYIYIKRCVRGRDRHIPFFFLLGVLHISGRTESWEKGKSSLIPHCRTVTHPESSLENISGKIQRMASHGINPGNHFVFFPIKCMLKC